MRSRSTHLSNGMASPRGSPALQVTKSADAQVYSPEPRADESDKVCVKATPTSGFMRWIEANCPTDCDSVYAKIDSLTTPGLMKGQYSLLSNNCETFARDTLDAACMTAPSVPQGGIGNDIVDEYPGSLQAPHRSGS